jgi:hypothetical protein
VSQASDCARTHLATAGIRVFPTKSRDARFTLEFSGYVKKQSPGSRKVSKTPAEGVELWHLYKRRVRLSTIVPQFPKRCALLIITARFEIPLSYPIAPQIPNWHARVSRSHLINGYTQDEIALQGLKPCSSGPRMSRLKPRPTKTIYEMSSIQVCGEGGSDCAESFDKLRSTTQKVTAAITTIVCYLAERQLRAENQS